MITTIAEDGSGKTLSVGGGDGHAQLLVQDDNALIGMSIDAAEIDHAWRAMRGAAGLDMPVVLGRPLVDHELGSTIGPLQVWERNDGKIGVGVLPGNEVAVEPHAIRLFAAAAVAHADHIEPELDAAEVDRLAAAICRARPDQSILSDYDRQIARAILHEYQVEPRWAGTES